VLGIFEVHMLMLSSAFICIEYEETPHHEYNNINSLILLACITRIFDTPYDMKLTIIKSILELLVNYYPCDQSLHPLSMRHRERP
jgi:hypothetical protein